MDKTPGNHSPKRYKGEGRVAFLANIESIRKEVEAGWPLAAVYDRHSDKLNIKYMQFSRYVDQYIRGKSPEKTKPAPKEILKPKAPVETKPKPLNDPMPLADDDLF